MSTLNKFKCGTGTVPSCPLLQANEAKAVRAKLDKTPKRPTGTDTSGTELITPDSKHQHIGKTNDAAPSIDNLTGTLIYGRRYDAPHEQGKSSLAPLHLQP